MPKMNINAYIGKLIDEYPELKESVDDLVKSCDDYLADIKNKKKENINHDEDVINNVLDALADAFGELFGSKEKETAKEDDVNEECKCEHCSGCDKCCCHDEESSEETEDYDEDEELYDDEEDYLDDMLACEDEEADELVKEELLGYNLVDEDKNKVLEKVNTHRDYEAELADRRLMRDLGIEKESFWGGKSAIKPYLRRLKVGPGFAYIVNYLEDALYSGETTKYGAFSYVNNVPCAGNGDRAEHPGYKVVVPNSPELRNVEVVYLGKAFKLWGFKMLATNYDRNTREFKVYFDF